MIFDRFRRKKQKGLQVPRSIFLKAKPVRNPALTWEKDKKTKEIKIIIPLKTSSQTGGAKKEEKERKGFLDKLFPPEPEKRVISLDRIGSIVWELCDGERTIGDIANYLVEKYKIMHEEAEISLNAYFNQLSSRGLIGFILPEELKKQIEKNEKT
ncbi:MAG: PqqD family protein [Candidatus Bathyarchaeia archaeon]